jgi:hypothetical protein
MPKATAAIGSRISVAALDRVTKRPNPARDDRYLMNRILAGQAHRDDGMTEFVVSHDPSPFGVRRRFSFSNPAPPPRPENARRQACRRV